jgi:hypothetical protein
MKGRGHVLLTFLLAAALVAPSVSVGAAPTRSESRSFSPEVTTFTSVLPGGGASGAGPDIAVRAGTRLVSASFNVTGEPSDAPQVRGDSTLAHFAQGNIVSGFWPGAKGPEVAPGEASLRFDYAQLASAQLTGVVPRAGVRLELATGVMNGTLALTGVALPGASFAFFAPEGLTPNGTSISLDIVGSGGSVPVRGALPGVAINLTAVADDVVSLHIQLRTIRPGISPSLTSVYFGTAANDTFVNGAITRQGVEAKFLPNGSRVGASVRPQEFRRISPDPVIPNGSNGSWYSHGQVTTYIVPRGGAYWMYFSGWNASARTIGRAVSNDLLSWTVDAQPLNIPGMDPAADFGSVVYDANRGRWNMYLTCGNWNSTCLATSPDGISWTWFAGNPIVEPAANSTWMSLRAYYPSVVILGADYYMYLEGTTNGVRQDIGLFTSADGENWTAVQSTPVIQRGFSYDRDVIHPSAVYVNGEWWLWYTCTDASYSWDTCFAVSADGRTNWTKYGIALAGDGDGFDSWATYLGHVAEHNGQLILSYTGLMCDVAQFGCPDVRALGIATAPVNLGYMNMTGTFDFGDSRPRTWGALQAQYEVPGASQLNFSVRSSPDGQLWSAWENVTPGSSPATTPVARFLGYRIGWYAPNESSLPWVENLAVGFTTNPRRAVFESRPFTWLVPPRALILTFEAEGAAYAVQWRWRSTAQDPWQSLLAGEEVPLDTLNNTLQYQATVIPGVADVFMLTSVSLSAAGTGFATNLTLHIGPQQGGYSIALDGPLIQQRQLELNASVFNGVLEMAGAALQGAPLITLAVSVRSSAEGKVNFSGFYAVFETVEAAAPPPSVIDVASSTNGLLLVIFGVAVGVAVGFLVGRNRRGAPRPTPPADPGGSISVQLPPSGPGVILSAPAAAPPPPRPAAPPVLAAAVFSCTQCGAPIPNMAPKCPSCGLGFVWE